MNAACREFRERLAATLDQRAPIGVLGWHVHLLGCDACQRMLASEEALETLLGTLPRPNLPPELARRVLARLGEVREDSPLDRLLELVDQSAAPSGLSARVGVELARARRLDRLLDRIPAPTPPADLARKVLAGLAAERAPAPLSILRSRTVADTRGRRRSLERRTLFARAAAVIVLCGGVTYFLWPAREAERLLGPEPAPQIVAPDEPRSTPLQPAQSGPDDELLAQIDLLESWDLLHSDDLDLFLSSDVDTTDEVMLDQSEESAAPTELVPKQG